MTGTQPIDAERVVPDPDDSGLDVPPTIDPDERVELADDDAEAEAAGDGPRDPG